ncbi:hypothetical protein [Rhodohalobacter sp. 614A]|nr:hypothetical protein [Rhodohalobacter sp. 614A]
MRFESELVIANVTNSGSEVWQSPTIISIELFFTIGDCVSLFYSFSQ